MRSLLFVPADDSARIARVHERGADGVILDLEDGVAPESKVAARAAVAQAAADIAARGAPVFVRVNADWRDDLGAIVSPDIAGVVAPKVNDAAAAAELVAALRAAAPGRAMQVIALIESPAALFNAPSIAAVDGVSGLALGGEDLCLSLGVAPTREALDVPCKLLALAAATRGLAAFGAPISIAEFRDLEAYRAAIALARQVGLTGALCIHPAQVAIANAGFQPTEREIEQARAVLEAWRQRGSSGVTQLNGQMIDAPVVARARRVLGETS